MSQQESKKRRLPAALCPDSEKEPEKKGNELAKKETDVVQELRGISKVIMEGYLGDAMDGNGELEELLETENVKFDTKTLVFTVNDKTYKLALVATDVIEGNGEDRVFPLLK